jgi:hypothetical protein
MSMALERSLPTNGSSRKGLPRRVAQAAAKKSWQNRDLPNWRDRVGDLLKGKQILVKDLREFNALYVAARRKGVQTRRFKLSNAQFAVVAEGLYCSRKCFAAEKAGICLDHSTINKSSNPRIVRVCSVNKGSSIKASQFPGS